MQPASPGDSTYQCIHLKPLSGALGVELSGVDLSKPIPTNALAEIKRAWLEYHVIVFRDQSLSPTDQARFCESFGPLAEYRYIEATTDHPNVIPIIKEADQKDNFGGAWHTDSSYMPIPPMATCLYAVEVPSRGGDTLFANTNLAFESLSDGMKNLVQDLVGVYTPSMVHGKSGALKKVKVHGKGMHQKSDPETEEQRVLHPIIRTHPDTGRKAIYCGIYHCERFNNMTQSESLPLLKFLFGHATKLEFTSRLRWEVGTLAMWDNRCVFHYALNDYFGERRHMHRVTIEGEKPA